jgi:hypothetical protein
MNKKRKLIKEVNMKFHDIMSEILIILKKEIFKADHPYPILPGFWATIICIGVATIFIFFLISAIEKGLQPPPCTQGPTGKKEYKMRTKKIEDLKVNQDGFWRPSIPFDVESDKALIEDILSYCREFHSTSMAAGMRELLKQGLKYMIQNSNFKIPSSRIPN